VRTSCAVVQVGLGPSFRTVYFLGRGRVPWTNISESPLAKISCLQYLLPSIRCSVFASSRRSAYGVMCSSYRCDHLCELQALCFHAYLNACSVVPTNKIINASFDR